MRYPWQGEGTDLVDEGEKPGGTSPTDEIYVKPRSRKRILVLGAVAIVVIIATAAFSTYIPAIVEDYFGPAPVWHTFDGVFDNSGTLVLEGCSLQNTQQVLPGIGIGRAIQSTIVICSFHGGTYTGYYGTDCNMLAAGPVVIVNGATVPLNGCALSQAPLNIVLHNLFTLGKGSNRTTEVYSNKQIVANMTPAGNWTAYGCSFRTNNVTKTNGPLSCVYMGTPYLASDVLKNCNLGAAVTINEVAVPPNSCYLERAESVTG